MEGETKPRRFLRPELLFAVVLLGVIAFGAIGTQAFPDDPQAASNRRISIVLLRQSRAPLPDLQ